MSGLSAAMSSALSGLLVTSSQISVTSKNISRSDEENYTRKNAEIASDALGNPRVVSIQRSAEKRLLDAVLNAGSRVSFDETMLESITRLSETVGDVEADGSIGWGIGALETAMKAYEANPSNGTLANAVVSAAKNLSTSLREATRIVQDVRTESDAGLADAVSDINTILSQIESLNARITGGIPGSDSVVDLMDQRDALARSLSDYIGVRIIQQPNNGIAIYSDSGVTMFDVSARNVTFLPTLPLGAGTPGNSVYIDGVQVTGPDSPMPSRSGRMSALVEIRDSVAPTYQTQLDEIARSLIQLFAEKDQSSLPSLPDATGLFTYSGAPSVPSGLTVGLAGEITIDSAYDREASGNPALLRDGGRNGSSYLYNVSGASAFQDRISALVSSFGDTVSFASAANIGGSATLKGFSADSASWLESRRAAADRSQQSSAAIQLRVTEALSRKSGVNIDEEMSIMLGLEKSYQASAKVMTAVNQMLDTLMSIVR